MSKFDKFYIVVTWTVRLLQAFCSWLDNTLPWRLRARLEAMYVENRSICTNLQLTRLEVKELKQLLKDKRNV